MLNLQSIYFGQRHLNFGDVDYDVIKKISRLVKKHQRQCENACNGNGYVKGDFYYTGKIDDWAKREYGQNVKDAYINATENTIFDYEIEKIENSIAKIMDNLNQSKYALYRVKPLKLEFQHDPRGNTVKLIYENDYIEL